jgi:hypothetical protein
VNGVTLTRLTIPTHFPSTRRSEQTNKKQTTDRFDCICCATAASPHKFDEPQGCCGICSPCNPPDRLPAYLKAFGERIVSPIGRWVTLAVFLGVLVAGVVGASLIYADFNLEWFIPEGSYLQTFFEWNDRYVTRRDHWQAFLCGLPIDHRRLRWTLNLGMCVLGGAVRVCGCLPMRNRSYFEAGTPLTVYTKDIDYFKDQSKMVDIHSYLTDTKCVILF